MPSNKVPCECRSGSPRILDLPTAAVARNLAKSPEEASIFVSSRASGPTADLRGAGNRRAGVQPTGLDALAGHSASTMTIYFIKAAEERKLRSVTL